MPTIPQNQHSWVCHINTHNAAYYQSLYHFAFHCYDETLTKTSLGRKGFILHLAVHHPEKSGQEPKARPGDKTLKQSQEVVAQAFNPSTREAQAGGSL